MAIANQDGDRASAIALEAMKQHERVLQATAPEFAISSVSDFMTKIAVHPYTTREDYWNVYFGVTELVKKASDANGSIGPLPTRVVYNK